MTWKLWGRTLKKDDPVPFPSIIWLSKRVKKGAFLEFFVQSPINTPLIPSYRFFYVKDMLYWLDANKQCQAERFEDDRALRAGMPIGLKKFFRFDR